jgi:hypothetical protein
MLTPQVRERAARFDYEYLGATIASLASKYGFSTAMLDQLVCVDGWQRKVPEINSSVPSVSELTTPTHLVNAAASLKEESQTRLELIGLYRQMEHEPLIAQLERAILEKALEIIEELRATDDRTPTKLVTLLNAAKLIRERNPVQIGQGDKDALPTTIVQIQNNIN